VHRPVLVKEVVSLLAVEAGGAYIDGTGGGGGHAAALLRASGPDGRLLVIDRDEEAVRRVRERLAPWRERCRVAKGVFSEMRTLAEANGFGPVDGVLLDLGVSSHQLEDSARGFSFSGEGPLDMRMDRAQPVTAELLVNESGEDELAGILKRYGEEPRARRVARAIVRARGEKRLTTTRQLAEVVATAKGGRRGRIHPATQTFQALRMAVNRELEELQDGLEAAWSAVRTGGRVAVIAFHSLEDRAVKRFFASHVGRWESLAEGGQRWVGEMPAGRWIAKKPVRPGEAEVAENPRARSARLRVAERSG
jgi:16S rRNA (cytosine1402-N4)-methyltransferase